MSKKALIFASEPSFGELINQVFGDFGGYDSRSVALDSLKSDIVQLQSVDLAVLDADLGHENLFAVAKILRRESPNLRLIVLPAKNSPSEAGFDSMYADVVLKSPFYLPDLIAALHKLEASWSGGHENESTIDDSQSVGWMKAKGQAAQYLTQLTLESSSEAAILIRASKLWAYAGELPQPAIEELLASLSHYWQEDSATDFARFVHLNSTDEDYMLYAKLLEGEFTLAMVFNVKLPFSRMRSKVSEMAIALQSQIEGDATVVVEEKLITMEEQTISQGKSQQVSSRESGQLNPVQEIGSPNTSPEISFDSPVNREALKEDEHPSLMSPRFRELLYSFALIPRLPEHQLTADLAYQITKWIPQLCLAYACRLEYLRVEGQSLQWAVSVDPEIAPEPLVQTMERQLSQRIFDTFPSLMQDNPSGEFWAKTALILNGEQASAQSILNYIRETRARQGIHGKP
jgi:CheY-like chemotaxis protein